MSSFALFTGLSMVFVKQNFHILCLCSAPDLRLGDDWTRLMCFTWRHHRYHFLASWHVVGLSCCGQALPPRSGSGVREASRSGGTGRGWAELGRVRLEVVILSGNLQTFTGLLYWSSVLSPHSLTRRQQQPELNSNFPEKSSSGFFHLPITFLSVFISRHCQNIQKHSDALTFLHYLLWGQWGSS